MSALSKYKTYPEYKDSGVEWLGEIPSHWEIGRGKNRFKTLKEVNRNLQCMERLSLTMNGVLERSIEADDGLQPSDFKGYQIFNKNDLVFKLIDLENYKTSRVGLVHKQGIMSPAYIRLQITNNALPKYYYYYYFDLYLRGIYNQLGGQGVRSALNASDLLELPIMLVDTQTQHKIVQFLDHETAKIDQLIEKQQTLIELLKEKRQAVISHAVTKGLDPNVKMKDSGVEWLGKVPEHWNISALKYLCTLLRDGTHQPPSRTDIGIPLLSVRNIINNQFELREDDSLISQNSYNELCKSFTPTIGDVLLAVVGGTLGKSAIINLTKKFHIQRSVAIFRTNNLLNNKYLFYFFNSQNFQELLWSNVGFSAQPGIYLNTLSNFVISLPSIQEQESIIKFLEHETSKFDLLTQKAEEQIELMKERRTALISAAVTGKIDVRDWQPEQ